jgi:membrane protein
MDNKKYLNLRRRWAEARSVWDESAFRSQKEVSKPYKCFHFCIMVWRSFIRNRCPVRASALAYGSLLALIPMLAVVMSITSTFLKKEGEERIDQFIVKLVSTLTPPATFNSETNDVQSENLDEGTNSVASTNSASIASSNGVASSNSVASSNRVASSNSTFSAVAPFHGRENTNTGALSKELPAFARDAEAVHARKDIARRINEFIQNTRSGALGLTGSVLLIFVAISMLSRIEDTFNDIWGVARGRSWFMRIIFYWGIISLTPLLLVVALGLAGGSHFEGARKLITYYPLFGRLIFQILPVLVLCFTFSILYIIIPNTKVRWKAAVVGGLTSGILFHLNNLMSVFYVSRVVSNNKIYGSLGLVPVLMIGLYLSWLILLFGAQVSYAFQNRASYLEEKQIENINQRGREFVALRLMTCIGLRFEKGEPPLSVIEMGKQLCVPTRLVQQIMHTLCTSRMVTEVTEPESSYVPARPLETISCYDILHALRASHGQELATRDEPTRVEVFGEFSRIEAAERQAGASVTLLALVNRAQQQVRALGE